MNIRHKITCIKGKDKLEYQPEVGTVVESKTNPNRTATINKYKILSTDTTRKTIVELSFKKKDKEILKDITLDDLHKKWQTKDSKKIKLHRMQLKYELLCAKKMLLEIKKLRKNNSKVKKFRNISYQI